MFYKIEEIELIKYLCRDVPKIEYLNENNKELIPYFIALEHFIINSHYNNSQMADIYKHNAYYHLYELLQKEKTRNILQKEFDFSIKNFRMLYSAYDDTHIICKKNYYLKNFSQKIFSMKNSKDKKHKVITILGMKIKIKRKKNAKNEKLGRKL